MSNFVVFLGAGASAPFGISTMTQMATDLELNLKERLSPQLRLYQDIKYNLRYYRDFDIEALMTVLQGIIDINKIGYEVLNQPLVHYFSSWGLSFEKMLQMNMDTANRNRSSAEELLKEMKGFIAECCSIKKTSFEIYHEFFQQVMLQNHVDFSASIQNSAPPHHIKCLIFTTNYDQVLEAYCRRMKLVYECGQLATELLDISLGNKRLYSDENLFHIYKLHGSINWYEDQDKNMRWLTQAAQSGRSTPMGDLITKELLIYPVQQKYTFREPFYSMFHKLKEELTMCKNCYVVGYSFRDDDILGLFHDAMSLNKNLKVFIMDPNANTIVTDKFSNFSNRIKLLPREFTIDSVREMSTV